jgi:hypothetical protein
VREDDDLTDDAVFRDLDELVVDSELIATLLRVVAHLVGHACLSTHIAPMAALRTQEEPYRRS